ncbi:hypothetical protein JTE90_020265 [Oedothorax gibbosus]|uniref:Sulfotransferase domain-containing protein n=1 Tax=Oedothorax gibbosus TaxID=931172 RepID=A0AAV6VP61_9ARAC|nr:hypothetical protein JTE90_020265 [Oedothorax gibbosus]
MMAFQIDIDLDGNVAVVFVSPWVVKTVHFSYLQVRDKTSDDKTDKFKDPWGNYKKSLIHHIPRPQATNPFVAARKGHPANNIGEVVRSVPYVAQDGWPPEGTEILALKYHLPLQLMTPLTKEARYIYVARNPKDACVSYYYFLQNLPGYKFERFDEFFDAFVEGELPYGDFFDHVADWVSVRHQPNVLIVTYESLHKDRRRVVADIADFIGIRLDASTLEDVLRYSSFEFMRDLARKDNFMENYLRASTSRSRSAAPSDDKRPVMMRRGIVGDWRNLLSPEQSRTLDKMLEEKVPDMMDTWRDAISGYF